MRFWKTQAIVVSAMVWAFVLFAYGQPASSFASPDGERITFGGSIKELSTGRATLMRNQATPDEEQRTLAFSVALKMRQFAELEERIGKGEIISFDEMASKYYPTRTDYRMVVEWLTAQGFTVGVPDSSNLSVFASGTVEQIERAFATKFGAVSFSGAESLSALTSPSLPSAVATPVLGVNGLQPYLHPVRHSKGSPRQLQAQFQNSPPYTVGEIAKAYGADTLSVNGAGQKIAIVIDTFPLDSDLTSFWSAQGIPQSLSHIEKIQVVGGTLAAPSGEETLDTEWTSGMAPGAGIRIYATSDLSFVNIDAAFQRILNDLPTQPTLHQVSISLGVGEEYVPTAQMQTDDQYFASMAAAGVTVFVSSGDGGSSPGTSGQDHSGPIQVETFASDPNVTAVGGTTLSLNSATGAVSGESAWFDGGGGLSQVFARPVWQSGLGVPGGQTRLVPDVALAADPNTGGFVVLNGADWEFGGTSWSAPTWAAFCARINQARANFGMNPVGRLGPRIYPLIGTSSFRDISIGANGPNGIYNAGPGYDLCTGLGVPNVAALTRALTLNQTGQVHAPTSDLNGDGIDDILWQNRSTGQVAAWLMDGAGNSKGTLFIANTGLGDWKIVGTADINSDGKTDILWQSASTGQVAAWLMDGAGHPSSIMIIGNAGARDWKVVGTADVNGDGKVDILFQSASTGQVAAWLMDGFGHITGIMWIARTNVGDWKVVGTADINGDGNMDILWQSASTGQLAVWLMDGSGHASGIMKFASAGIGDWKVVGTSDINNDGIADILWQNTAGQVGVWIMDGKGHVTASTLISSTENGPWRINGRN